MLARTILDSGYSVIVDATNLKRSQRQLFQRLAQDQQIPFAILDFQAPKSVLRERVERRELAGQDASEATISILENQFHMQEPLDASELASSIAIKAESPMPVAALVDQLQRCAR